MKEVSSRRLGKVADNRGVVVYLVYWYMLQQLVVSGPS